MMFNERHVTIDTKDLNREEKLALYATLRTEYPEVHIQISINDKGIRIDPDFALSPSQKTEMRTAGRIAVRTLQNLRDIKESSSGPLRADQGDLHGHPVCDEHGIPLEKYEVAGEIYFECPRPH